MELLDKAGHPVGLEQALATFLRTRQWASAAQVALQLDRPETAARLFLDAQQPYEAAVCFQRALDLNACLEALLQVPQSSPRYRPAAVHAIRVALTVGAPLEKLSRFLVPFLGTRPATQAEAAALDQLAAAFARASKRGMARSIFRSVLSAFPDDAEARDALAALPPDEALRAVEPSAPHSKGLAERLVEEGLVGRAELNRILARQHAASASDAALCEVLVAHGLVNEEDLVRLRAGISGTPYLTDAQLLERATPEAAARLTVEQAERWLVVPVSLTEKHLQVAMRDPGDIALVDQLRFAAGVPQIAPVFATELGIRRALRKLYHGEWTEPATAPLPDADPDDEDWRGKVFSPHTSPASAPFSDRYTGTREHQFDSQELAQRAVAVTVPPPALSPTVQAEREPLRADPPAAGEVFAGRYRLEAKLGQGGSAVVFRAMDLELDEPVAVKVFNPSVQTEALVARFKLELSLSRQLAHPNIIRVFDLGHHAGWRYLTMELLDGSDLATRLAALGGPMAIAEGLEYLEQIASGLGAAHDRGVIHRDIKPQNLFVTRAGVAKVMDFGLAKRLHGAGVTVAGMVAGTPEFMSPEQINGFSSVTHLTDLYALGATAYAMFTGQPPFANRSLTGLLLAHLREPPRAPSELNPALPPALEAVILRLLEKDPAHRYASCREVSEALAGIARSLTGAIRMLNRP